MRQVVLDTETTGLFPPDERIVEIGCVEIIDRKITGRIFQTYLSPEGRESHPKAFEVHGLTTEFLADKPLFKDTVVNLSLFLLDSELIIHNAPFDLRFLNAERARIGVGLGPIPNSVIDTLRMPNSGKLDVLCDRHGIDRTNRGVHGALKDARLLALVYLAMTGGSA